MGTIRRWETTTPVCHEYGQHHVFIGWSVRDWFCPRYRIHHGRDVNAAINILKVRVSVFGGKGAGLAIASNPC